MTHHDRRRGLTRRSLMQSAALAGAALSTGVGPVFSARPARAAAKTLKILQWSHFVPAYDAWFNTKYIKE